MSSFFITSCSSDISTIIIKFLNPTEIKKRVDETVDLKKFNLSSNQQNGFLAAHNCFERASSLNVFALLNKSFYGLVFDEIKKLKNDIVHNIHQIYIQKEGAKRLNECVENGCFLTVLKIYYSANPLFLKNKPTNPKEEFEKTIIHSAFSASAISPSFISFILKINQEYFVSSEGNKDLLNKLDSNNLFPINRLCNSSAKPEVINNTLTQLFSFSTGALKLNSFVLTHVAFKSVEDVSPLYFLKNSENIKILLDNGADVNLQNKRGNTVLHIWARQKKLQLVKTLLENGANPNLENKAGKTALDEVFFLCHKKMNEEDIQMIRCLKDKGAKITKNIIENYPDALNQFLIATGTFESKSNKSTNS